MSKPDNPPRRWLMKSEPDVYGWDDLVAEGEGTWDGVRNHRAANNLRAMQVGDLAFFYHSNIGKEIVGIAVISQGGLTDPTDPDGKWACVKVKPLRQLANPVNTPRGMGLHPQAGGGIATLAAASQRNPNRYSSG